MSSLSDEAIRQLFSEARTHKAWLPQEVSDKMLRDIYSLMKWGPTSANTCPTRLIFVKSPAQKAKLLTGVDEMNVQKIKEAPVTVIIALDEKFYDQVPKLFPHAPETREVFAKNTRLAETTAFRNSSLQGAYFILAARALGLDCGPMSGFNNQKIDELFLSGTSWKSNFLCNVGYGDKSKLFPRLPRLDFEEACRIL